MGFWKTLPDGEYRIRLVNNTQSGFGCVVVQALKGHGGAHAGLEVGHVIQSVNGQLAWEHREVIKQIDDASGTVEIVVAKRKLTEANVLAQHVGQVPVDIIVLA